MKSDGRSHEVDEARADGMKNLQEAIQAVQYQVNGVHSA
jgi:hypothetical protein